MVKLRSTGAPGQDCLRFKTEIVYPKFRFIVAGALPVKGQLVVFDNTAADAGVNLGANPGDDDYVFGNVQAVEDVTLTATQIALGFYGIAMETAVDDEPLQVAVSGRIQVRVATAQTPMVAAEAAFIAVADAANMGAWAAGAAGIQQKILAIAIEETVASPALSFVLFDGITGFGIDMNHA